MKGSAQFTAEAAERIHNLLAARSRVGRAEQKRLRDELRALRFFISDWGGPGFTAVEFDALVRSGHITVIEGHTPNSSHSERRNRGAHSSADATVREASLRNTASPAPSPSVPESVVEAACEALTSPQLAIPDAAVRAPRTPGLYAVYGADDAWCQLGLQDGDSRPLYVGKSEDNLAVRDIATHFRSRRTGQSTLRRSLAALLRDALDLNARPRNPRAPAHFSNYALDPDSEERLTRWMHDHLSLAFWSSAPAVPLLSVERAVLARWEPPLNTKDVRTPWTPQIRAARAAMADEARQWAG